MSDEGGAAARFKRARKGDIEPAKAAAPKPVTRSSIYVDSDDWQTLRRFGFENSVNLNSLIVASLRHFFAASAEDQQAIIEEARRIAAERKGDATA